MMMKEVRDYLLSLNASNLSALEIETAFDMIATLPSGKTGHPRTFTGRQVSVLTYLSFLKNQRVTSQGLVTSAFPHFGARPLPHTDV